jgi:transposase
VEFNFIDQTPDQLYLMAPDVRDWLPAGHLAWRVRDAVEAMDLDGFLSAYRRDGQGAAAFHPAAMISALLYCYCKGIRSSRAIEQASFDDVGVRVLLGNHHPDHATVARFVHRHRGQMQPLFVQVLIQCAQQGLVSVDLVAVDGTKVRANAAMGATVTAEQLDSQIADLEAVLAAEVRQWLDETEHDAAQADRTDGDGDDVTKIRPAPARAAGTLGRRRAARTKLAAEEQARLERAEEERQHNIAVKARRLARIQAIYEREAAAQQAKIDAHRRRVAEHAAGLGPAPVGPVPMPSEQCGPVRSAAGRLERARQRHTDATNTAATPAGRAALRVNTTDPDSRIMPGKDRAYLQGHNLQILANTNQIVLGVASHDSPTDVAALHPLLHQARTNLDAAGLPTPIGVVLADAGYASTDNFTTASEAELLVAVTNDARQTGRRKDQAPKQLNTWTDMGQRLATENGKKLYKRRGAIIEPVFAQLFQRLGRTLNYRNHTTIELLLWTATHNLLKLFRNSPAPA